mmetsp:Transcript_10457/g.27687  ORF Transcript_10457/g.27687 Transcript_10457/m.27687 type:complete len:252 (-) Transcript_10457:253-1008(-)
MRRRWISTRLSARTIIWALRRLRLPGAAARAPSSPTRLEPSCASSSRSRARWAASSFLWQSGSVAIPAATISSSSARAWRNASSLGVATATRSSESSVRQGPSSPIPIVTRRSHALSVPTRCLYRASSRSQSSALAASCIESALSGPSRAPACARPSSSFASSPSSGCRCPCAPKLLARADRCSITRQRRGRRSRLMNRRSRRILPVPGSRPVASEALSPSLASNANPCSFSTSQSLPSARQTRMVAKSKF